VGILSTAATIALGAGAYFGARVLSNLFEPIAEGVAMMARTEAWIRSGLCADTMLIVFDEMQECYPDMLTGMAPEGLAYLFEQMIRAVVISSMVLTEELAEELFTEMLQEGFSNSIQTSVGGALTTALNYWRGGQPLNADEIEQVYQNIDKFDDNVAVFLAASAGNNVLATQYRAAVGFDRHVEDQISQLRWQLRWHVDRYNDAACWPWERHFYVVGRAYEEGLSAIEAAYRRAMAIYDHVCERALSRIQELISEVETLKSWYEWTQQHPDKPLVDEGTAELTLMEDEMELDAVYNSAMQALETVDTQLESLVFNVKPLLEEVERFMYAYSRWLNRFIEAGKIDFTEQLDKINETFRKLAAIRSRYLGQAHLETPGLGDYVNTEASYTPPEGYQPQAVALVVHVEDPGRRGAG